MADPAVFASRGSLHSSPSFVHSAVHYAGSFDTVQRCSRVRVSLCVVCRTLATSPGAYRSRRACSVRSLERARSLSPRQRDTPTCDCRLDSTQPNSVSVVPRCAACPPRPSVAHACHACLSPWRTVSDAVYSGGLLMGYRAAPPAGGSPSLTGCAAQPPSLPALWLPRAFGCLSRWCRAAQS